MEHFHVLSTQSKVSGWEFYTSLARRTENTGTTRGKVRVTHIQVISKY